MVDETPDNRKKLRYGSKAPDSDPKDPRQSPPPQFQQERLTLYRSWIATQVALKPGWYGPKHPIWDLQKSRESTTKP